MFLRTGGIIPTAPGLTNIHNQTIENLNLLVEPSAESSFTLYEDDGKTNDYQSGDYLTTHYHVTSSDDGVIVDVHNAGKYASKVKHFKLEVLCPETAPAQVSIMDKEIQQFLNYDKFTEAKQGWFFNGENRRVIVKFDRPNEADYQINLNFSVKDLISI